MNTLAIPRFMGLELEGGCLEILNGYKHASSSRTAWIEIDLGAFRHNLEEIRRIIGNRVKIIAVVKANAYGHGGVDVAKALNRWGVDEFAVAILAEALELRASGVTCPILVLGCSLPHQAESIVANSITQTVTDLRMAWALSEAAQRLNTVACVQAKIDTGMGRLGIEAAYAPIFIRELVKMPSLALTGIFTHLACADEKEDSLSQLQLARFRESLEAIGVGGVMNPAIHAANSAGILRYPESHFNMVRPGLLLYGLPPYPGSLEQVNLRPVLSFRTEIVQVREFARGSQIGYGSAYTVPRDTRLAIVPVGYADGLPRSLSDKGFVLVKGRKAPIIGRICMDQFVIDVGGIGAVKPGDVATIIGRSQSKAISVLEIAEQAKTIQNEIVSSLAARLPRIYVEGTRRSNPVGHTA